MSSAIGCVVYMSCAVEAPGVIRHGAGRQLIVGEPDNRSSRRSSRRVALLAEWLRRSGFDCAESTDIRRDIWFKLWGNISMNPISLLTAATLDRGGIAGRVSPQFDQLVRLKSNNSILDLRASHPDLTPTDTSNDRVLR